MDTAAVATRFAELCKAGKFEDAAEEFWSADIVSIEPMEGPMARLEGIEAVRKKGEWWYANHDTHSTVTEGPYMQGDQFALHFRFDVTAKESGKRMQLDEIGLYTVKDGKVVEERFLFGG